MKIRTTVLALAALALAAGLAFAQQGPPPQGPPPGAGNGQQAGGGGPQGPPPEVVLKEALGLTDDQVVLAKGLLDARRAAMEALRPQIQAAEKALGDALHATPPDAATVGAAAITLDTLRRQVPAIEQAFHDGFLAILTDAQKGLLDAAFDTEKNLRLAQAAHAVGL